MMRLKVLGEIGNQTYAGYIDDIFHAGNHLLSLISDLLDISKIEIGATELSDDDVDLEEIITSAMEMVITRASARGVSLMPLMTHSVGACAWRSLTQSGSESNRVARRCAASPPAKSPPTASTPVSDTSVRSGFHRTRLKSYKPIWSSHTRSV